MTQVMEAVLSHNLEPICPRDDHQMHFEAKGIAWKSAVDGSRREFLPSYHCNYDGCSVRYDLLNGYFTVVLTPEQPYFIEEPGVNLLRCPQHGTRLYRSASDSPDSRYEWHCGVEGCTYVHQLTTPANEEPGRVATY
jgi:hypothetical protein